MVQSRPNKIGLHKGLLVATVAALVLWLVSDRMCNLCLLCCRLVSMQSRCVHVLPFATV